MKDVCCDLSLKHEALKDIVKKEHRYQPDMNRDLPVIEAIQAVLEVHPGYASASGSNRFRTFNVVDDFNREVLADSAELGIII